MPSRPARPRHLELVKPRRIVWRNPGDRDGAGAIEPCEILDCFEQDGCTWYLLLLCDDEQILVPSDEVDLDCPEEDVAARRPPPEPRGREDEAA